MNLPDDANVTEVGEQRSGAFRDPDLTDQQAINAMRAATNVMVEVALAQRRVLLNLGFASEHTFCRNLDRIAREMAEAHSVLRRMETDLKFPKPSEETTDG